MDVTAILPGLPAGAPDAADAAAEVDPAVAAAFGQVLAGLAVAPPALATDPGTASEADATDPVAATVTATEPAADEPAVGPRRDGLRAHGLGLGLGPHPTSAEPEEPTEEPQGPGTGAHAHEAPGLANRPAALTEHLRATAAVRATPAIPAQPGDRGPATPATPAVPATPASRSAAPRTTASDEPAPPDASESVPEVEAEADVEAAPGAPRTLSTVARRPDAAAEPEPDRPDSGAGDPASAAASVTDEPRSADAGAPTRPERPAVDPIHHTDPLAGPGELAAAGPAAAPPDGAAGASAARAVERALAAQIAGRVGRLVTGPDGDHELSLELEPADLGRLELRVRLEAGVVHIQVEAGSRGTSDLLRHGLAELRDALVDAGLTPGSLDVRDQPHFGGAGGGLAQDRRSADRPVTPRPPDPAPVARIASLPVRAAAPGRVDVLL